MTAKSSSLVSRPRLLSALDRAPTVRLVLVTAPGGYGKSVLLRDWEARRSDAATAWIELDVRDNDATRLWNRILDAINLTGRPVSESIASDLGMGRAGELEHAIDALTESLRTDSEPLVIVFDDFHVLRSPQVLESFDYFRDTAPHNVGIVLVGRQDPQLSVARLRLLDEVVEIREKDLRLTEEEIAELTEISGFEVDAEAITHVHAITAGWAAAVRMAMVSASNSPDPNAALLGLDAHDRALSDFFVEEVLSDMPKGCQEFLLSTSILDKVNASIASRVSTLADHVVHLEDLSERSILTTRVGGSGDWYQYHDIFRGLLTVLLSRSRSEEEIRQLHHRAAEWYDDNDDSERAIPHWLAAGDSERAAEVLVELSPLLMQVGRASTLLDLSQQVIDAVDLPTIAQLVCKGEALHALGRDPRELDRMLGHIEEQLSTAIATDGTDPAPHAADPRSWESPSALPWVRSVRYRRTGAALELVELNRPDVVPSPARAVESEVAEGLIWLERFAEADELISLAALRADENGYVPHIVHNLGLLATSQAGRGLVDEAESVSERALALCDRHNLGQIRHTMYARLIDVWLAWRKGDMRVAESRALDLQEFAESAADIPIATRHALLRSSIRASLGDRVGARSLLDRAITTSTGLPLTDHFRDRIRFARARLDLLEGDVGGAQIQLPNWRDRLESDPSTMREWLVLMRFKGAADGPTAVLEASPPLDFEPVLSHQLEWQRVRAHALDLSGERDKAVHELASSLEVAVNLSLTQPLLDEQRLLGSLLPLAAQEAGVELHGIDIVEDAPTPQPVYVEPLTDREQDVLEYMATHLSYPEIAAELYVSNNTVKSHTRAVFRKLAVSKRTDAIARARYYGLIR